MVKINGLAFRMAVQLEGEKENAQEIFVILVPCFSGRSNLFHLYNLQAAVPQRSTSA